MREKLETLSLTQLRELAKAQGLKTTGLRKAQVIDLLVEAAEKKPEYKPQEIHSLTAAPAPGPRDRAEDETVSENRQKTEVTVPAKAAEKNADAGGDLDGTADTDALKRLQGRRRAARRSSSETVPCSERAGIHSRTERTGTGLQPERIRNGSRRSGIRQEKPLQ